VIPAGMRDKMVKEFDRLKAEAFDKVVAAGGGK
jgi:hypothetical protein